jgi:cyanophycin synthetase
MRLGMAFDLPEQVDFALVNRWLALLEEDDELPVIVSPATDTVLNPGDLAPQWLMVCLRLALALLQAARVPVFAVPRIRACTSDATVSIRWHARFEFPLVDFVPRLVYETALNQSFKLARWLASRPPESVHREAFYSLVQQHVLVPCKKLLPGGKSTWHVLRAAHSLGIPFRALGGGVYQLGWGANAQRIDRSTTGDDSAMGSKLAQNKVLTTQLLRAAGLPAPLHSVIGNSRAASAVANRLGWPVVIKPADLDRGVGVAVDVTADSLQQAFETAQQLSRSKQVIVERQVAGVCHRLFIARGRLLYAVKRLPMGVYGDGVLTIAELVAAACAAEQLKPTWKRSEIQPIDALATSAIAAAGFGADSIPATGCFVPLRRIESTAMGGVDEDVTDRIHPENLRVALAAAELLGLDVAGVDIISSDITQPWYHNGAIINEVNFAPLLGGGDISRRHIPEYLKRLLAGDGRIPVEVYCGGAAAWQAAVKRRESLGRDGVAAFLSSDSRTLDNDGADIPMPFNGVYQRSRALMLSPRVAALVLVVQTDELLHAGLPLEGIEDFVAVDRAIVSHRDRSSAVPAAQVEALLDLMQGWLWTQ